MCCPSWEIAGPPKTCASSPLHNSVLVLSASFQILSPVPVAETYKRKFGPSRGENPVLVVREIGAAAVVPVAESAIGNRQSVLFGLAIVTTRRGASAAAASDVNRSGPVVSRWGTRRSTFTLYSHGPEPSESVARYNSVRRSKNTG